VEGVASTPLDVSRGDQWEVWVHQETHVQERQEGHWGQWKSQWSWAHLHWIEVQMWMRIWLDEMVERVHSLAHSQCPFHYLVMVVAVDDDDDDDAADLTYSSYDIDRYGDYIDTAMDELQTDPEPQTASQSESLSHTRDPTQPCHSCSCRTQSRSIGRIGPARNDSGGCASKWAAR